MRDGWKTAMIKLLARRGLAWIKEMLNQIRSRCFRPPATARDKRRSLIDRASLAFHGFIENPTPRPSSPFCQGGRADSNLLGPIVDETRRATRGSVLGGETTANQYGSMVKE